MQNPIAQSVTRAHDNLVTQANLVRETQSALTAQQNKLKECKDVHAAALKAMVAEAAEVLSFEGESVEEVVAVEKKSTFAPVPAKKNKR